jgi:Mor transcription activator family
MEPYHVLVFLHLLYGSTPALDTPVRRVTPLRQDRNREIYQRYLEGARAVELAAEYGISLQRIYVIIRMEKRNQR